MVLSHLRCFAPWARRGGICRHHGDDSIVRSIDQIVKIAGRNGPEYRQLLRVAHELAPRATRIPNSRRTTLQVCIKGS